MWKQFFCGNAHFEIEDAEIALLNKLRNFNLRNITVCGSKICFDTNLINKHPIIKTLGKKCFICKENRHIFSFFNFFGTRKVLTISAGLCLVLFVLLNQLTFRIKIEGLNGSEYQQVNAYVRECGITRLSPRKASLVKNVAQSIVERFDFVAATSARVSGTSIVFSIHRAENPIASVQLGDLISPCDGVISDIVVFGGTAQVSIGDVIRKGDVLVSGERTSAIIHLHNGDELVCIINNTVLKS